MPGKPTDAQVRGEEPYISRRGDVVPVGKVRTIAQNWDKHVFHPGVPRPGPGRPKGESVVQHMRRLLDEPVRKLFDKEILAKTTLPKTFLNRTVSRALATVILKEALKGDAKFMQMALDRLFGTVAQRLAGPDGGPLDGGLTQVQINMLMSDPKAAEAARIVAEKMAELEDAEPAALPAPEPTADADGTPE